MVSFSAGINLLVTAIPADHLISMVCLNELRNLVLVKFSQVIFSKTRLNYQSKKISDAVTTTNMLVGRKAFFMKNCITIVQRSHKPIKLRIPGFIPELSLEYYFKVI